MTRILRKACYHAIIRAKQATSTRAHLYLHHMVEVVVKQQKVIKVLAEEPSTKTLSTAELLSGFRLQAILFATVISLLMFKRLSSLSLKSDA